MSDLIEQLKHVQMNTIERGGVTAGADAGVIGRAMSKLERLRRVRDAMVELYEDSEEEVSILRTYIHNLADGVESQDPSLARAIREGCPKDD